MADPYCGEIRLMTARMIPEGWQACDGTLLPVDSYNELFVVIGTTYGGDGINTFAVPDMRGRVPIHRGQGPGLTNRTLGQTGGTENVVLQVQHIPPHTHIPVALSVNAQLNAPAGAMPAGVVTPVPIPPPIPPVPVIPNTFYAVSAPNVFNPATLNPASVSSSGENAAHENRMPSVAMAYIIATTGLIPYS